MEVIALRLRCLGEVLEAHRRPQLHLGVTAVAVVERVAVEGVIDLAARGEQEDGQGKYRDDAAAGVGVLDGVHLAIDVIDSEMNTTTNHLEGTNSGIYTMLRPTKALDASSTLVGGRGSLLGL